MAKPPNNNRSIIDGKEYQTFFNSKTILVLFLQKNQLKNTFSDRNVYLLDTNTSCVFFFFTSKVERSITSQTAFSSVFIMEMTFEIFIYSILIWLYVKQKLYALHMFIWRCYFHIVKHILRVNVTLSQTNSRR